MQLKHSVVMASSACTEVSCLTLVFLIYYIHYLFVCITSVHVCTNAGCGIKRTFDPQFQANTFGK